jgi:hypothetical protein
MGESAIRPVPSTVNRAGRNRGDSGKDVPLYERRFFILFLHALSSPELVASRTSRFWPFQANAGWLGLKLRAVRTQLSKPRLWLGDCAGRNRGDGGKDVPLYECRFSILFFHVKPSLVWSSMETNRFWFLQANSGRYAVQPAIQVMDLSFLRTSLTGAH